MKVDLNNPLVYHKPISFERSERVQERIINRIAKRILRSKRNEVEKEKTFIITYPDCLLLDNERVNKYLNKN